MEQVEQYVQGERDYTQIKGGTGPLVYPAAHVYIYLVLYKVTDEGRNILMAQRIFGVLYLATIGLVMACYRRAKVWFWRSYTFVRKELTDSCRHHCTSSQCSSSRNDSTVSSSYASSTIVSPSCSYGLPSTCSNGAYGRSEPWHTVGDLESRCRYFWLCQQLGLYYSLAEVYKVVSNRLFLWRKCSWLLLYPFYRQTRLGI